MMMHSPSHPGIIIFQECIEPLGLTITEVAKGLGVTRKALSELIHGRAGVSTEMAVRLEKAGWSTADTWLKLQMANDLWRVRQKSETLKVTKFEEAHA
jgi:addiction module HigA family antidote